MLSNRWRYFLISSCFVSRSVCFLQLPLFLLSSSSSTLSNSSVNMNNVFHCEVDSPSVGASAATHTLTAVVHCLLLQRCSCYCVHALDLLWLVFTSHYSRSTAPLISPRPRNLFCFVLLTEPNVTQDFRASPGAARQVAGGGPRQVWPRPPMYQTEPSSHLSLYGLNCSWRFQQLTHLLQVYTTLSCSLQSDPHDQCLLQKHKSAETFRLVGLNLSVSLRHNAVLMFWFSLGTRTTWSGSENILVWIKILVLVTTITDGEESESESESESELL